MPPSKTVDMKFALRVALAFVLVSAAPIFACTQPVSVCAKSAKGSFALIVKDKPTTVFIDNAQNSAVKLALESFAVDLGRVSGTEVTRVSDMTNAQGDLVIAGVVGQSALIDELTRAGKIDVADLPGQWEAYKQIVVEKPFRQCAARAGDRRLGPTRRGLRHLRHRRRRSAFRRGTGAPTCRSRARPISI